MAKNPLYRNEYYFFSDMYDDSLITEFYRKITSETYDRSKSYQHNALGRTRHFSDNAIFYKSKLGDFKIDNDYNSKVGIPEGSRTITFNTLIIPVHDKRKYISTYGIEYKKIPLTDLYKRNDIFDKAISLQIGRYRIMHAYLIENVDKTVTLAIPTPYDSYGISSAVFDKILSEYSKNEPVWLFSDEITQLYYYNTTVTSSVSKNTGTEYYEVIIPKTAASNNIGNYNTNYSNSWDCLVSVASNTYGKNVLVTSTCTYKGSRVVNKVDSVVFAVNKKFIDALNGVNVKFYFINRPNRKHLIQYKYNKSTSPILNLEYYENPTGNINIEVFEYSSSTACKGRKLYDPEFTQVYFPNIFDFSQLNTNNSDLLIEVTEYPSSYTNQKMNNSISPLIESLGSEFYTEYVVNGYDKAMDGASLNLKEYAPKAYPISMEDYISSDYYGDYRGYMLDKISKTIESDPYLIASYYKWMESINSKVYTFSGTPRSLRFGTTKTGEFSGSNKIVMDTSEMSIISDDIHYFNVPHSYISYYSSGNECPANIYINGKYISPTCFRHYKGTNYVFFPVSLIEREMSIYSSDEELIAASPISIDFYPMAGMSNIETASDTISINSSSDSFSLFTDIEKAKFSLGDLVVYDNLTGKYIGNIVDVFNVNLDVLEYIVKNPGEENKILISREDDPEQLLTILNEIYCTADGVSILVGGSKISLSINEFIESLIADGVISESDKGVFLNKKLDFSDIRITPKDQTLIGYSLSIYNRAFKSEYTISSNEGIYNADEDVTVYDINNANVDPDVNRYFVFENGLLNTDAIISLDDYYNGKMTITFAGDRTLVDSHITVVHMPITYKEESYSCTDKVFYMQPANTLYTEPSYLWNFKDNLFDKNNMMFYNAYINTTLSLYGYSNDSSSVLIECEPNTTYTISHCCENVGIFRACYINNKPSTTHYFDDLPAYGIVQAASTTEKSLTVTTGDDSKYIVVQIKTEYFNDAVNTLRVEENLSSYNGIVLQSSTSDLSTIYAFENSKNIKFFNGLRLPPCSKSTNRIYAQYYDSFKQIILESNCGNLLDNSGVAFRVIGDIPFTDIAKQNPYSDSYDNSRAANPLDILTHF